MMRRTHGQTADDTLEEPMDALIADAEAQVEQERQVAETRAHHLLDGDATELRALTEAALQELRARGRMLFGWLPIYQYALTLLHDAERATGAHARYETLRRLKSEARKLWNAKRTEIRAEQLARLQEVA